jgi:hypothetical protein
VVIGLSYQHLVVLAATLPMVLVAAPCIVYAARLPASSQRQEALATAAVAITGLVSVALLVFLGSAWPQVYRLRFFDHIVTEVPFAILLIYLCSKAARLYGAVTRPGVQAALNLAPLALVADLVLTLLAGAAFPDSRVPWVLGQQRYLFNAEPWYSGPLCALLYVPELPYLVTVALLFAESAGQRNPSPKLRLKNRALSYAALCWACIMALEVVRRTSESFLTEELRVYTATSIQAARFLLLVACGWLVLRAAAVHLQESPLDRFIEKAARWLSVRNHLSMELRTALFEQGAGFHKQRTRLLNAARVMGLDPADAHKADLALRLIGRQTSGWNTLLGWLRSAKPTGVTRSEITLCAYLQNYLIAHKHEGAHLHWSIDGHEGPNVAYDIEDDPIHEILGPVLLLTGRHHVARLTQEPEWIQLAAFAAADGGLLPDVAARDILSGKNLRPHIKKDYYATKALMTAPVRLSGIQ